MKYNNLVNSKVFTEPIQNMQTNYLKLDSLIKRLENTIILKKREVEKSFQKNVSKLDALSPLKTLARGFSIIEKNNSQIIKSKDDVKKDDEIKIIFLNGSQKAKIL